MHAFLAIKTPYKQSFKRMIEYGFELNPDFIAITQKRVTAQKSCLAHF
ncbi:antA/AntB antirepressor family protein [Metabacillus sp. FJAT-52054]